MKRISRNFLYMFASDGITRLIGFAATVYIARVLAVEGFGLINYGLAFISYALLFANPGLTVIGAREVAKDPGGRDFIEETLGLRLALAAVIFVVLVAATILIPGDPVTRRVIIIYALVLFPFALLVEFVFQGREEMGYVGGGRTVQYTVYLVLLLLLLRDGAGILAVPLAFLAGYLLGAGFLLAVYIVKYRVFRLRFSIARWKRILTSSIPVGLAIIFNQATVSLPVIALGVFRTQYEVGIFSAGYKIIFTLLVIERVFYYVFFPVLSRQYKEDREKLAPAFNFLTRFLFAATIPLALGGMVLAPALIDLIYGRPFAEAAGVLRILLAYFAIVPVNTIFGYGLIAIDREDRFLRVISITALLSAALILLLGARFGGHGAAAALCVGESLSILLMGRELRKSVRFGIMEHLWRPLIAGSCMAVLLFVLRPLGLVPSIGIGAVAYGAVLFLTKGFSAQDIKNLRAAVAKTGPVPRDPRA